MVETSLDKGIVTDAYVRVSLVEIELLTVDARIVVASVDTYLRFAEATNRLDLEAVGPKRLPDLLTAGVEKTVTHVAETVVEHKIDDVKDSAAGAVRGAVDKVEDAAESVTGNVKGKVSDLVDDVRGHRDSRATPTAGGRCPPPTRQGR